MITTYKPKAYDAAQDINGLKDQLGSVLKEISAFGSRLEETKALQLHAEEYGFARSFSYEERLRDLKLKLQPGREPAKPVIFLTRMVVESLSRGPMSEKDIKTIVLDRCKELGIKSSNRGLIAGTGMDVATVCSVLAALGAIEATAPPDPKAAENAGNLIDTTSGPISSSYASASSATDTIGGVGSGVYSVLTDRWQNRLSEYIQDALQSKAAMLLEADAMSSGAGLNSAGSSGGIGKVFSNNTSANTSAGVTPSASSNNIASMVSPVNTNINASSIATGTTSNAATTNTINSTTYNNTAPTNASLNNTNVVNTASTSTNNTNANSTAVMSNTARLIAEYHSRNGTDPNAITNTINTNTANPSTLNTINSTIPTTVNPSTINTSSTLPVYNGTKGTKSIQSYYTPLNGSTNVNNVNSNMSSVGINGTSVGNVGGIGSVGQTLANNIVQNTPNTMSTLPMSSSTNTIGYRAPLAADAIDGNASNSMGTGIANINTTNTTLKAPYTLPTYTSSVPQYNHTLPQAINNTPNTTQAPTSLPVPTLTTHNTLPTTYTTSNPATTPATVGFLSVTHPSNKLVLPNMSADGTLSHSTSLSNVGSGMSGVSIGSGVGGASGIGGNIGVSSNGMSGSMSSSVVGMNGINTTSTIGINNTINPLNTTMNTTMNNTMNPGLNNMQYNVPMVHNTMPIVPNLMNMNTYPTNTALPTFVTNTTNSYNNLAPYNPNNTYPNTYTNTLPNSTMNTNMVMNTTNNTNTTNTKAKAPKPPKPPAEKKLSKKAAAAAAKLLETNNTNIGNTNIGISAGGNGSVAGSVVGGSASSSVTGAVNANKARRGPSALRVWKLREEYVLIDVSNSSSSGNTSGDMKPVTHNTSSAAMNSTSNTTNAALSLLLDPSLLHTAASTHYTLSSTQELEERILRRIAGLCNIPLQPTRYRAGTSTISSDTESKVSRVYSTFKYTPPVVEEVVEAEPSYAVYDDTTTITATYLLDKIRRTKRQRGDCLYGNIHLPYTSTSSTVNSARSAAVASVGVYSAPHVHALSAVVAKSNDYYWNSTKVTQKAKKAVPAKSVNEPITMAQYARNIHTGTGGNSIVLSSCSNGSSITNHTLKRYAQPLELTNAHLPLCDVSNRNVFAAATTTTNTTNTTNNTTTNNGSVVLSIPDLTLNTREIAWTEIASEFAILPAPTEEGSIGFGYSASTAALDSVISVVPVKTEKKRKYLNNHEKLKTSGKGGVGGTSGASGNSVSAASLAMEVLAPQFVEIVPAHVLVEQMKAQQQAPPSPSSTSFSTSEEQEGEEDLSDEAFAARHEATLQAMRDKWTRLQQLKNDALYGVGNGPEVKQYRGGGYGGYFNRATAGGAGGAGELNLTSPGLDNANKFANLSPRKRGLASAHAKRRGRPPKNAKFHNNLHNHSASAALASNSVGNTDGETMEVDD